MKRWLWVIVFLLSIGINIGWIGHRVWRQHRMASEQALFAELERPPESRQGMASEGSGDFPDGPIEVLPEGRPPGLREGRTPGRPPRFLERMADELRLTGDERDQFVRLQQHYFRRSWRGRRDVATLQHRLRQEVVRGEPDRRRIDRLLREVSTRQLALEQDFVDHLLASRELLEEPQDRRFLQLMSRWRRQRVTRWAESGNRPPVGGEQGAR